MILCSTSLHQRTQPLISWPIGNIPALFSLISQNVQSLHVMPHETHFTKPITIQFLPSTSNFKNTKASNYSNSCPAHQTSKIHFQLLQFLPSTSNFKNTKASNYSNSCPAHQTSKIQKLPITPILAQHIKLQKFKSFQLLQFTPILAQRIMKKSFSATKILLR